MTVIVADALVCERKPAGNTNFIRLQQTLLTNFSQL